MNVLLLQTDMKWQDAIGNRKRAEQIIAESPKADIIILPEMFTTGFCVEPQQCAEPAETDSLEWMRAVAKAQDAAVASSVAVEEDGKFINRFYFVMPDGSFRKYDKRHLFAPGGEGEHFTPGNERVVVEWRGFRILLQVCYDLRFPVFSRNKGDYDMIIYIASWPIPRIGAWDVLTKARAIENQCFVAAVNRTGLDPYCEYNGHTALIDYMGRTVVAAQESAEDAVMGRIDIEEMRAFREKFPAWRDSDKFTIEI